MWDIGSPLGLGPRSCRFDSCRADCDVRELVNPARCERVFDGLETRTSPQMIGHVSPLAWTAACQAVSRGDRNPYVAPIQPHRWTVPSLRNSERRIVTSWGCHACPRPRNGRRLSESRSVEVRLLAGALRRRRSERAGFHTAPARAFDSHRRHPFVHPTNPTWRKRHTQQAENLRSKGHPGSTPGDDTNALIW